MSIHIHNHHHVGTADMPEKSEGAHSHTEPGVEGLKKLLHALESDGQGGGNEAQIAQQEQLGKMVMQVVQMIHQMMSMGAGMLGLGR